MPTRSDAGRRRSGATALRYSTSGTHKAAFCGLPPTGKRVGVPVVSIMKFRDGEWKETWSLADELGIMLQLGAPNLLLAEG